MQKWVHSEYNTYNLWFGVGMGNDIKYPTFWKEFVLEIFLEEITNLYNSILILYWKNKELRMQQL